jgi:hypothetical protein
MALRKHEESDNLFEVPVYSDVGVSFERGKRLRNIILQGEFVQFECDEVMQRDCAKLAERPEENGDQSWQM